MTVGELISLFPAESTIQINVITGSGSLVFIPDPGFYQQNPKAVASVDRLPVASINIEVEESDGKQIVLLVINDTRKLALAAD
ncbi:MAG: hypothetical protein SPH82_05485 [Eubacteriales bacterium]|nr:hypothetical protein [Eubacteriales bacterium]